MSVKYPRTPHLPYSPGGTEDDERLTCAKHFVGRLIVIFEKMDGANWCMTSRACFARSHSGNTRNPIFDPAKPLWAMRRGTIENGLSVFAEWLYYTHSIRYASLPSPIMLFGARYDKIGRWVCWEDVEIYAACLDLPTVPVLWIGVVENEDQLQRLVENFSREPSACGGEREGVVVRLADAFEDDGFGLAVAKWVRKHHIQRDPNTSQRNRVVHNPTSR